ncbi:flippase (plasmid) [Halorussus limi]|uniref:Flippase n=1 Tax=Halorussus limi TaxID=2938695 RepID=A0A8U0I172_9EURY|nr:flippase [Halorussus limi]UPV76656.1 flippase [Halorussus limi]
MDIARSTLKLYVAQLGSAALVAGGLVFFSRELGAATMGVFFLFQAVLEMLMIPADFGVRGAVEKRISEGESPPDIFSTGLLLKAGLAAFAVAGILVFRGRLNEYIGAELALYLAVAVVLREFSWLMMRVLKGELRVEETATLKFVQKAVWIVGGGALVYLGWEVEGLVYGLIGGFAAVLVWGTWKVSTPLGRPSRERARSLVDYSKYNVVTSVQGYVGNWLDVVFIGFFLSQTHVGAYEVSWRVTTFVLLLSKAIAQSIFPQISEWSGEDATGRIERLITSVITPSVFLLIPALVGTALLARPILELVFGAEFGIASVSFVILMGFTLIRGFGVVFGRALGAIDEMRLAAISGVAATTSNVLLNAVLVFQFGLVGAATATLISSVVGTGLDVRFLSQHIDLELPVTELKYCAVSAGVMGVVVYLARSSIGVGTLWKLGAVIALGGATYGAAVLAFRPLRTRVLGTLPVGRLRRWSP